MIKNQFGEASRWDIANAWSNGDDMGLYNIGDEPGAVKWNPRAAFFYLYYFGVPPSGSTGGPLNYASIKANAAAQNGGIILNLPDRAVIFFIAQRR